MTGSKRIAYLDIARGVGMILVVMGHVEYVNLSLRQFIAAFHMPLFFLISGILIWEKREEERNFIDLVKRKLQSIMLPYVIFSLLSFAIEGGRLAIKGLDGWDVVFRQLFQSFCLQGVSTLWFLPALFMSEVLFIGVRKRFKNSWTIGSISAIVIVVAALNTIEKAVYQLHAHSLAWSLLHDVLSMLLRNLFCVGFVCAGYYIGKHLMPWLINWKYGFGGMLGMVLITGLVVPANFGVDLRYMNLGNVPMFMLGAVGGAMAVILCCCLLERLPIAAVKNIFAYYGRNSLIIMVTHMDFRVLFCSIKIATMLDRIWSNQLLFCTLIIILVFVIEIPVIWFVNRFLPMILGKRTKIS